MNTGSLFKATLPQASLLVINPSGNRIRVSLSQVPFTIGRQADNHLVLRDNRASRQHARICLENGSYLLEDLQSRHGVYVNGRRIHDKHRLATGDRIEFGVQDSYQLIFTLEEAELLRLMDTLGASGKGSGNLSKLRALVEVARTVQSSLSTHSVLAAVLDAALMVTGADRGFLLLRKGEALEVEVGRSRAGATLASNELKIPTRVLHQALTQRRDLLAMNFDPAVSGEADALSSSAREARSVVCVPLIVVRTVEAEETMVRSAEADTIGLLYLEAKLGEGSLSAGDRELLQTLAIEASAILENARLLEQERGRVKMEEELKIAREIQQSLMPRRLPQQGWFRAACASIPSHQVGGDYCDIREIAPDTWAVVVADVSGKGVSSALLASLLQGAFLAGGHAAIRMDELMEQVNQFLTERTEGEKYATLFCAVVCRDGRMRWTNAGHCPPLVLSRDGGLRRLEATSLPLGLLPDTRFEVRHCIIPPGDKIVVYTDGISEAQNRQKKYFDVARIEEVLRTHSGESSESLLQALLQAVERHTEGLPQGDDMTAAVLEYGAEDGFAGERTIV